MSEKNSPLRGAMLEPRNFAIHIVEQVEISIRIAPANRTT
jgi:hypothetical protein